MTLREKQSLFIRLLARLILHAELLGYELTGGDLYRDKRCDYGHPQSLHRKRLAVDLNLFIDGDYQRESEAHEPLGSFWKSLHPLCRWGGDFSDPDGNHYSLEHDGIS